jgi:signal transduction histidine kinase
METLGALAAGLTHDFNNILNTIATNVALASDPKSPREAVQARLEHISEAAAKAADLIKRLTQFSRTQELHVRALRVNDVVRDVLRLVHPLLRDNVNLNVDLAGELPHIYGDSSQLEQVFVNLIVNALDAMPDGGELGISTERAQRRAKLSAQRNPGEFVQVSVSDTGVGIPKSIQNSIFEPFFTTKPEGKGTGLGLSSAYGIVRQHNGKIEVESVLGEGSTFRVLFPAAAGQSFSNQSVA